MRNRQDIDDEIKELQDKLNILYNERNKINKDEWIHKLILTPNNTYMKVDDVQYHSYDRILFKGFGFRIYTSEKEYCITVSKEEYCLLTINDLNKIKKLTLEEFNKAYEQGLNKINSIDMTDFMNNLNE